MDSRDYYADLELPVSADVNDIKKQFRKLALKYHPDRNPGREQEVNAQFQIIQSAHEVLSDPDSKAKYDASRTRSRYPTSSGVRGNPWSNVATNFPPPPRRNNQSARPPPPPPPSGAQRWQTRFSSGVPPTAKQAHGSEAKKNAAQAFENMRKSGQARESRPQAPPPPPRSESARQKAQASFGSRKGGFQPRSGMMGDEPPVTSNNYTRRPDTERYAYGTPEPKQPEPTQPEPKQPPPPPRPVPDPLRQFREQSTPFDSRQSTPYSAHIGERTNPFDGIPLNRAKSTRETNRRDDTSSDEEETASFRQRSASAPKTSDSGGPSTPRRKPVPAQEPKTTEKPQDRPKAPLKKNRSFPTSNQSQPNLSDPVPSYETPGAPHVGPQATPQPPQVAPDANSSKPQSNGAGGPSMYARTFSVTSPCFYSPTTMCDTNCNHGFRLDRAEYQKLDTPQQLQLKKRSPQPSTPSGGQTISLTLTSFEKQQHKILSQLIDNAGVEMNNAFTSRQTKNRSNLNNADQPPLNSFNFSGNEGGFSPMPPSPHQFARSSTDDIDTSFVDDEDSTTWQFSAGGAEEAQPKSRSQSGSRTGRRSPLKRPPSQRPETPSVPSEPGKSDGAFNAEGWSDKFGPQTFVPQRTSSQSASPTKSHRGGSRKPKPTKTAGGSAVVIDDNSSDDELFEWRGRKTQAEPTVVESPQAMDIDSPPNSSPAAGVATGIPVPGSPSLQTNAARNINVEPTRPEWRPGNTEAANGEPKPPPVPDKVKEFDPNTVGSEDSEEFRANFADFKNVAPFAQQESGLKSFTDLRDTLPFDSRPSADVPIKIPKPTPLAFPTVPTAPQLPQTVLIHGIHPNKQSWEKYVKEFETYLQKWDNLNSQVVDHFTTRKAMIAKSRDSKGYAFLEARDNTDIQEYCSWVQQDIDVRQRWSEACKEHQERLKEFMVFRQKMK